MDKKLKEKLEADLKEQLTKFKEQEETGYENYNFRRDRCLVKVFKFKPSDKTIELSRSEILMVSSLDGSLKTSFESNYEKIFPIVKVIKRGHEAPEWVEEGRLYTVPYNDVVGETWNPEFQWLMQSFSQKRGDGKPGMVTIPDDMPQKLQKIDVQWERYKFAMPDRIGAETDEDKLVYFIPSMKLEADYEI